MDDVLRRRSVGAPAARSTLLTVLGEFLLPRPEGAWQEALIGSLRLLGFTPSAARQAVVRSAREGWLEGERVGRRSRMRLTASSYAWEFLPVPGYSHSEELQRILRRLRREEM